CLSPTFNSDLPGFRPTSITDAAGARGFAAADPLSLFADKPVTGVTAVSCFALRLVVDTFAGDDTNVFKAVLTSAVCSTGEFWLVVIAADFGCGIAASVCIDAGILFASVVNVAAAVWVAAVLGCAGVFTGRICCS